MSRLALRLARSRSELKDLLRLAVPIMVAQLSYAAMGFVDTVMAGQVSARDLAAVALGNSLWVPVFLLMTGILLATTPKVAQCFGAQQQARIPPLVHQALWLALLLGGLCGLALWHAEPVLQLMRVDASLVEPAIGYLRAIACGFPAIALFHVLRCYSDGLGLTRPTMVLAVLGLLLNIPLNYLFIYGKLGLPAMGGVGCGWATSLVMLAMLLGMLGWVSWAPHYRHSRLLRRFQWPQLAVIRRLLGVGLPIGIAVFAESSIFALIALLIGAMGATMVAGHQIALNFSSLVFMIPYALGMAVTVRVGHALGAGAPREARFSAGVGMGAALFYACLSSSAMLLLRDSIADIYTNDPAVIAIAASLLVYSAIFQFSDAIQVTAAGALRGYQDTRIAMLITLFAYWGIGLPVGYCLGLDDLCGVPSGPQGLWQGLVVGLSSAALLLGIRLVRSARRRIRPGAA
ncbi:MATE family efflux transporter [Pseudomonas sp. N040]|uniref:MATE family efflux transporter n=1 Tax=Pseudomonas sp. N040 TaxID=2785325 RepID=UPI0018A30358|nr:MATE family efflux transporter [Pseudomonas sp. N040]MBF7730810.1 MATE family efflux transporter [Pseudomonas sp. N040]MBW7014453.1 MATE family efflux transporter [Pseudomonas sp. N040]